MDINEIKVKEYFEKNGFTCETFTKSEKRSSKTPDFRVNFNGRLAFYCEVKSINDPKPYEVIDDVSHNYNLKGLRKDTIFDRISEDIHEAVKQFDAVNGQKEIPNVLALINHDDLCGFNDLLHVLTGEIFCDNGKRFTIFQMDAIKRINLEKNNIHLFIWLDDYKPLRLLFHQTNEKFYFQLCQWFQIKPNSIVQID